MLRTVAMFLRPRPQTVVAPTDIYAHTVTLLDGAQLDLATRRGHPTLFVNTASKCGYTPQYAGLQALHQRYAERGFEVIGSPSGDFADQEFDDSAEIGSFCQRNYGVTFPLTERTSVRAAPGPLWHDLITQPGSQPPSWNFAKYLVDADGHLIATWSTRTNPEDPEIIAAIEHALAG